MKQVITTKEWEELSDVHRQELRSRFGSELYSGDFRDHTIYLTFGILWELLGSKIECMFAQSEKGTWVVDIKDRASLPKQFEDKEPIVALWKAYKFTLTL